MRIYRRLIGAMFMLSLSLLAGNGYGDAVSGRESTLEIA